MISNRRLEINLYIMYLRTLLVRLDRQAKSIHYIGDEFLQQLVGNWVARAGIRSPVAFSSAIIGSAAALSQSAGYVARSLHV
jgi:hypothetical protein